jgi:hypothetical protein
MRQARAVAAVAAAAALSACFAFAPEPLKPDRENAVVRSAHWGGVYRGGYVGIVAIGGHSPSWKSSREVMVPAGEQVGEFYVYLCSQPDEKNCNSVASAQIPLRLEAERIYVVRAREKVNGSNQFWIWVEDQASRAVAGGTPPPS